MYSISIPMSYERVGTGTEVVIAGWSLSNIKSMSKTWSLKKMTVTIENQNTCLNIFNRRTYQTYFASKHMCATPKQPLQEISGVIDMIN